MCNGLTPVSTFKPFGSQIVIFLLSRYWDVHNSFSGPLLVEYLQETHTTYLITIINYRQEVSCEAAPANVLIFEIS